MPAANFGERVASQNYVVRPSAYGLIMRDGAVLLVQGTGGGWFFPGGGLEPGETREAGLAREMIEETGCRAIVCAAFARAIQHVYSHGEQAYFELQATYHSASVNDSVAAAGEHRSEWVTAEAALARLHREADRWAIETYLRR